MFLEPFVKDRVYLNISELLQQKHITQKQLAQKVKMKPSSVSRVLSGKYNLKLDTIKKIAKALNVSYEYLTDNKNFSEKEKEKENENSDSETSENLKKKLLYKTEENEMLKHQIEILKDTVKLLEQKVKKC